MPRRQLTCNCVLFDSAMTVASSVTATRLFWKQNLCWGHCRQHCHRSLPWWFCFFAFFRTYRKIFPTEDGQAKPSAVVLHKERSIVGRFDLKRRGLGNATFLFIWLPSATWDRSIPVSHCFVLCWWDPEALAWPATYITDRARFRTKAHDKDQLLSNKVLFYSELSWVSSIEIVLS